MVKQPGRSGRPLAEVTWLGEAPSSAQRTAGSPLVQKVPMGRLSRWGMADQGNLTRNHVEQASDSLRRVAPLFVLGIFLWLSAKFDPFQTPQLSSKKR